MSRRAATIPAHQVVSGVLQRPIRSCCAPSSGIDGQRGSLASGEDTIPAFIRSDVSGSGVLEVRGEVWDIGRMEANDQRLAGKDLRSLLGVEPTLTAGRVRANWSSSTSPQPRPPIRSPRRRLRNIVLAPDRYVDQRVTIQGQFRGRNLFGDQPQAPPGGDGRKEFVLRSADAALWVTGKVPKGRGFTFDIASRLDTRRWLEVSGVVKEDRGLVWIVAEELTETSPQAEKAAERIVSSAPANAARSAVQRADQRRDRTCR